MNEGWRGWAGGGSERWVRRTDRPLIVLALAFLAILLAPVADPDLPPPVRAGLAVASGVIWAVFLADYLVRLYLAPDRARFVRANLLVIAVPILLPLRALRAARMLRLLGLAGRIGSASRRTLHARAAAYVGLVAVVTLFVGAAAMLLAERSHPDRNIDTFPDALWWAATTMTTVGYGDRYPVTTEGRLVAGGLMVVGIALLGILTAAIAAWFVSRLAAAREEVEETVSAETRAVLDALADLTRRIDRLERHVAGRPPE